MRRSDRVAALAAGVATAVLFGFVALPILAIFLKVSPSELVSQLGSHVARFRSGREDLKAITSLVAQKPFCHLASCGVSRTNNQYFFFFHNLCLRW